MSILLVFFMCKVISFTQHYLCKVNNFTQIFTVCKLICKTM